MTTETIDQAKLGAFMERVLGDAAGLMTSTQVTLGDRLGLFRAIAGEPTTSGELAAAADINERYAREWLRGMHAAGYPKAYVYTVKRQDGHWIADWTNVVQASIPAGKVGVQYAGN